MHQVVRRTLLAGTTTVALLTASLAAQAGQKGDLYHDGTLQHYELTFKDSNYWQLLNNNRVKKIYIKADLKHDGKTYTDVGVRFRGNSSWLGVVGKDKKPFKIKLDEFVPGQRIKGYRTLNLNNNFLDPTMMREPLSYWVLRQFMPAPGCNFAKLTINGKNWGIYINAQQINKDFLKQWYDEDGGIRYRGEWIDGETDQTKTGLTWLGASAASYQRFYQVKTESAQNPLGPLADMIGKLNNSGNAIATELPKALDVDTALRYVAGCNLLPLHDSYTHFVAHNYWMYRDETHQHFHMIPWDLNNSLGCYPFQSISQSTNLDPYHRQWKSQYPLVSKLLANPDWKKRYTAHFRRAWKSFYNLRTLKPKIAEWRGLIDNEVRNDPKAIYPFQQYADNFIKNTKVEIWVPGLEPFIGGRDYYLSTLSPLKAASADIADGGMNAPKPNEAPLVWARVASPTKVTRVSCYWRTVGAWQRTDMFDDGKHWDRSARDGIWAVNIPAQKSGARIEYYFEAENNSSNGGTYGYFPAFGGMSPKSARVDWKRGVSPIQVHELLAKNTKGVKDSAGEREDWIELCNTSRSVVSVAGFYLTDDLDRPTKWKIPTGTAIAGGGTLLIWADEDQQQGSLHANFKLSSNGETLALFAPDGETMLDEISFGPQQPDVSAGRVDDRADAPWVRFSIPTPGALNAFSACGARSYNAMDPAANPIRLELQGTPKANGFSTLAVYGAPANSWILATYSANPGNLALPAAHDGARLLFGSQILVSASARADGRGELRSLLRYPSNANSFHVCIQTFAVRSDFTVIASNGLEIRPCR